MLDLHEMNDSPRDLFGNVQTCGESNPEPKCWNARNPWEEVHGSRAVKSGAETHQLPNYLHRQLRELLTFLRWLLVIPGCRKTVAIIMSSRVKPADNIFTRDKTRLSSIRPFKYPQSSLSMVSSKLRVSSTSYNIISKLPNVTNILSLFGLPRLAYDLIILSTKISFAVLVAACRLAIPPTMKNLSGDTILITGTGRGVGKELAIQLSALGCTIVCWDSDRYANRATMNAILENGGKVYGFVVDVSNRQEVSETASMMHTAGIPDVTILINNEAVLLHQPLLKHDSYQLEETFRINVMSNFSTIEAFLPAMIRNNKGHIVSISGVCGIYGVANKVPYCASQFAVTGLMEALREELRCYAQGGRINFTTVYPFYINPELGERPSYRFPYVFGSVSPKYAAQEIIKAIRRNYVKYSIPRGLITLNSINRIFPESVQGLILDFFGNANRE